jgi:Flp pilus assembly protein TadG
MPVHEVVGVQRSNQSAPFLVVRNTKSLGERIRARLRFRNEHGSSLLEFALCLPPLMIMMTGTFAIGLTLANYEMLNNAVGTAAMQLATQAGQLASPYDPCALVVSLVEASAPSLKPANMNFSLNLNGTPYPATGTSGSSFSCTSTSNTAGPAGNLKQGTTAQITVTYPCNLKYYGANNFPSCTLTATTSEAVQ